MEELNDRRDTILHLVKGGKTLCGVQTFDLEDTSRSRL